MYRKWVWGICPVFPSHLPIPMLSAVWLHPFRECAHMISYLFAHKHWTCCWLSVHIYWDCRAEVSHLFFSLFLTVFKLISFLLCHLFFLCGALQEIWNGTITPPVEVANGDIFSTFIFASSLFSLRSSCAQHRQGE